MNRTARKLLVATLLATHASAVHGQGCEPQGPRTGLAAVPQSVVAGDFDGRHGLDLALVADSRLFVSLNDGRGGYDPPLALPLLGEPAFHVAVGDLDEDGRADLLLQTGDQRGWEALHFYAGLGGGRFAPPVDTGSVAQNEAQGLLVDVVGGPSLDLAVPADTGLWILPGRGDGSFEPGTLHALPDRCRRIVAADWIPGGGLDLLLAESQDFLHLAENNSDGSFTIHTSEIGPDSAWTWQPAVTDYDGDGLLDFVSTGWSDGAPLVVAFNRGDGSFVHGAGWAPESGSTDYGVLAAELDGVPGDELVVTGRSPYGFRVLTGDGGGGYRLLHESRLYHLNNRALVLTDADQDGIDDLVLVGSWIEVAPGLGGGRFASSNPADGRFLGDESGPESHGFPGELALGDHDGDGLLDAAVLHRESGRVSVALGLGDGTFAEPVHHDHGEQPESLAAADFDGDGLLDLAVGNFRSFNVEILRNESGAFSRTAVLNLGRPVSGNAHELFAGDFTGDGAADVLHLDREQVLRLHPGNGDGSFGPVVVDRVLAATLDVAGHRPVWIHGAHASPAVAGRPRAAGPAELFVLAEGTLVRLEMSAAGFGSSVVEPTISHPRHVRLTDVDGDGLQDVLVSGRDDGLDGFELRRMQPDGSLGPPAWTEAPVHLDLRVGELDGNPGVDLAFLGWAGVSVLANDGAGAFSFLAETPVELEDPLRITSAFPDGAAVESLVLWGERDYVALENLGAGAFAERDRQRVLPSPQILTDPAFLLGQFTGGPEPDLLLADVIESPAPDLTGLTLREGLAGWTFTAARRLLQCESPGSLVMTDLDLDGRDELVLSSQCGELIALTWGPGGRPVESRRAPVADILAAILASLDADRSGARDVACAVDDAVLVFLPPGDGSLGPSLRVTTVDRPRGLAAGDLNGDGFEDLAVRTSSGIQIHFNESGGSYRAGPVLSPPGAEVFVADVDARDGADVLVGRLDSDDSMGVFLNDGSGAFSPLVPIEPRVFWASVADLNGDGHVDVLGSAREGNGTFGVHFGGPELFFGPHVRPAHPGCAFSAAAANLSGDELLEVVTLGGCTGELLSHSNCLDAGWLMRDDSVTSLSPLSPPLATFMVSGLELTGDDGTPQEGEGGDPQDNGSLDDDDAYLARLPQLGADPELLVESDPGRPLVFYQLSSRLHLLRVGKAADGRIRLSY